MGAGELNYRIRNGNGCDLTANATGKKRGASESETNSALRIDTPFNFE